MTFDTTLVFLGPLSDIYSSGGVVWITCTSLYSPMLFTRLPNLFLLFDHFNNIWWRARLLVPFMKFSPGCYFHYLGQDDGVGSRWNMTSLCIELDQLVDNTFSITSSPNARDQVLPIQKSRQCCRFFFLLCNIYVYKYVMARQKILQWNAVSFLRPSFSLNSFCN